MEQHVTTIAVDLAKDVFQIAYGDVYEGNDAGTARVIATA